MLGRDGNAAPGRQTAAGLVPGRTGVPGHHQGWASGDDGDDQWAALICGDDERETGGDVRRLDRAGRVELDDLFVLEVDGRDAGGDFDRGPQDAARFLSSSISATSRLAFRAAVSASCPSARDVA